ncbi:MAG: hypothetical protein V7636_2490 [Actinomycetota bacterium]
MPEVAFDVADRSSDLGGGRIELTATTVAVEIGEPPYFAVVVPRAQIRSVERVDASTPARGAHGRRGRWLVNTSGRNLVRLAIEPPVRAALRPPPLAMPRWLRIFVRDRDVRVSELTLSLAAPEAALQELHPT